MRALVKTEPGPGHLELQEIPIPRIGADDVLVEITYCGVCGSDLHMETGTHPCSPPVVLGHEWTGVVAQRGERVTQFSVGDPVSFWQGTNPYPGVSADGGFKGSRFCSTRTAEPTSQRCPGNCIVEIKEEWQR